MSEGGGCVSLSHAEWRTIMAVLDGDESLRDEALDALNRIALDSWVAELDDDDRC